MNKYTLVHTYALSCVYTTYFNAIQIKALSWESSLLFRGLCEAITESIAVKSCWKQNETVPKF